MAPIVTTSSRKRPHGHFPLLIVSAIVIVAVVSVCLLQMNRTPEQPQSSSEPDTIAKQSEKPTGSSTTKTQSVVTENPDQKTKSLSPDTEGTTISDTAPSTFQSSIASNTLDAAGNAEEEKPVHPPHFPRESEQLISMVMSVEPGMEIPPVPLPEINENSTEEDIAAAVETEEKLRSDLAVAVTNDIVIYDTDSEKLAETKEAVADTKFQLAEIVKNGGSVTDAIREYTEHVNEGARLRSETIEKITPVVDSITNDAEAVEYVESVNEALKKEDIPPLHLEEVGFEVEEPQGP